MKTGLACGAVALSLTACAPAFSPSSAAPPAKAASSAAPADLRSATDPVCTSATKVSIVGTAKYAFSPARLTIARGGFLAITNKTGRVHALQSSPDAGIVTSVLD